MFKPVFITCNVHHDLVLKLQHLETFSRIGHFEHILLSGTTAKVKILITLTGQQSGANVKPEVIMGDTNGFLLTEARRMF